jgi:hypothetical protein
VSSSAYDHKMAGFFPENILCGKEASATSMCKYCQVHCGKAVGRGECGDLLARSFRADGELEFRGPGSLQRAIQEAAAIFEGDNSAMINMIIWCGGAMYM